MLVEREKNIVLYFVRKTDISVNSVSFYWHWFGENYMISASVMMNISVWVPSYPKL